MAGPNHETTPVPVACWLPIEFHVSLVLSFYFCFCFKLLIAHISFADAFILFIYFLKREDSWKEAPSLVVAG